MYQAARKSKFAMGKAARSAAGHDDTYQFATQV